LKTSAEDELAAAMDDEEVAASDAGGSVAVAMMSGCNVVEKIDKKL
jgi:hypothetical protein